MNRIVEWIVRLIPAAILIPVGYLKLSGNDADVQLFTELGMEPHGRVIIGLIELSAGLLLLSPQAALGALLGVGVMFGAIIAHVTVIGFEIKHVSLLCVVLLTAMTVAILRRRDLPVIGKTLGGEPPLP